MTLEERYFASKDNYAHGKYSGASKQIKDHSSLNIDGTPTRYNKSGKLGSIKDTSKLNIDIIPKKYHP